MEYDITMPKNDLEDKYQYLLKDKNSDKYVFVLVNVHDSEEITIWETKEGNDDFRYFLERYWVDEPEPSLN